jgi:hypothetical protein
MAHPPAPALVLRDGDEPVLAGWVRSSSVRAGLAQRARIVLLAADGVANVQIAALVGVSVPTVTAWRSRYQSAGLAGLEDRDRSGRPREIDRARIITATLTPPLKKLGVTHWPARLLARHLGIDFSTVAPHLARARSQTLQGGDVQVLHRPRVGGQGHRRGRTVHGPAGERGGAVHR